MTRPLLAALAVLALAAPAPAQGKFLGKDRADWQKTLDGYGVNTLILNKDFHADLIRSVASSSAWRKVYEDKMGVVFTRK